MKNIPNILSITRLLLALPVCIFVLINKPWAFLVAAVIFAFGALTDFLDGYLAKRLQTFSPLGIFLDLAADKIFVISVLIAMVQVSLVSGWLVIVIAIREVLITSLRIKAASLGSIIPTRMSGKQKTLITLVSISTILLAKGLAAVELLLLGQALLILAVLWTIFSGIEYIKIGMRLFLNHRSKKK